RPPHADLALAQLARQERDAGFDLVGRQVRERLTQCVGLRGPGPSRADGLRGPGEVGEQHPRIIARRLDASPGAVRGPSPMSSPPESGLTGMRLHPRAVATRLPARDLDRARAWYHDKLGLDPSEEREGG